MTLITLLIVAFAVLIGYGLGRTTAPSLRKVEEHLEAISCSFAPTYKRFVRGQRHQKQELN
jgi:hypothetical protein